MSRKTRKLIWSAPLMAVFAVVGALAMFVMLAPNQAQADHELLPSAPTNLSATPADGNDGRTALVVSWTAPERGPVTGYRIDYSLDNIEYQELVADSESTVTTHTHMGLKPGTMYVYRVFAINSAGVGLVSETYSSTTDGVADTPDDVANLTAARATTTPEKWSQINVSWTEPYGGGADITGYCIEIVDDGTPWPIATAGCRTTTVPTTDTPFASGSPGTPGVILPEGTMTSYADKDLDAGERRYYRVFAITGEGTERDVSEMPSNEDDAMTAAAVDPDAPTGLRAAKSADNRTVNLYWYWPASDGGDDIVDFRVEVTTNRSSWPKATEALTAVVAENITANEFEGDTLTPTGTTANDNGVLGPVTAATASDEGSAEQGTHTHAVPDAAGAKTLYYRVFTQTAAGRSTYSNTASVMVNGGINPTSPTFVEANVTGGAGKVDLDWDAGTYDHDDDGGTPVVPYPASGYRIDYAIGMGATAGADELMWKLLWGNTGFTDTEFTHDQLKPNTRVYYRIFTIGSNQVISTATGPLNETTDPAGALDKVRNLMAMADDPTKITVTWDAPENLGTNEIDHYSVQMAMRGTIPANFSEIDTEITMGPVTTFMHTKLTQNQTWLYRVAAVAKGRNLTTRPLTAAEYTAWANATTPAAEKPEAPVGLVAEDARDSSLTAPGERGVLLIWNIPEGPVGSEVREYEIQRMVQGTDSDFKALATLEATVDSDGDVIVPARTSITDDDEPDLDDGEVRHYRVRGVSDSDVDGEWATVRFPADTMHDAIMRTSPTDLMVTVTGTTVSFTWTDGALADEHTVGLVDLSDYSVPHTDVVANGVGMHEYSNVAPGRYMVAVLASPWMAMYYDVKIIEVTSDN